MAEPVLKRKSFIVDEQSLRRARTALGVSSDAEAIRTSLERVAEMEEFWSFMDRSRKKLTKDSVDAS